MITEVVKIDSIHPLKRNPRKHPEKQIAELVKSIEQFGQYRALVVDETDEILAGNGLYEALVRSGAKEVSIYRVGGLSEDQKKKLILADNKTADLAADDLDVIDEILGELADYEVPGYDPEVLARLFATMEETVTYADQYGVITDAERDRLLGKVEDIEEHQAVARETTGKSAPASAPSDEGTEGIEACPTCGRAW